MGENKRDRGFPTKQNRKEKGRLGFASARSTLQEANLEIHSSSPPLHSFSCSPPYSHPSPQPKNLRPALNPLSVLSTLNNVCALASPSATQRCFCVEISRMRYSLCFGPNMPILWHEGGLRLWLGYRPRSLPLVSPASSSILSNTWHVSLPQICTGRYDQLKVRANPWSRENRGKKSRRPLSFFFFFLHRWTIQKVHSS